MIEVPSWHYFKILDYVESIEIRSKDMDRKEFEDFYQDEILHKMTSVFDVEVCKEFNDLFSDLHAFKVELNDDEYRIKMEELLDLFMEKFCINEDAELIITEDDLPF